MTTQMPAKSPVALLAEGVDRNHRILGKDLVAVPVALLAEGVDRNTSMPS